MSFARIIDSTRRYYEGKLASFGPTHRGVDWSTPESQRLRFEQLLRIVDRRGPFSINDYGCGYGGLASHLKRLGRDFRYRGFDISEAMVAQARGLHGGDPRVRFTSRASDLRRADYTVASGIFNVKLKTSNRDWEKYVDATLRAMARISRRGFAFNVLTRYSDRDRMRRHLYYADPGRLFDRCKAEFSRHVALLHDYGLYEFTILVRTQGGGP